MTFSYDSKLWTNLESYNEAGGRDLGDTVTVLKYVCYTSQLKYVFRLEENLSGAVATRVNFFFLLLCNQCKYLSSRFSLAFWNLV